MWKITDPIGSEQTITKERGKAEVIELQALLTKDADLIQAVMRSVVQAALEAEMTEALGAEKGERTQE